MLTAGDALAKALAKSQKVTVWSQKNGFECFFWLTAGDALRLSWIILHGYGFRKALLESL